MDPNATLQAIEWELDEVEKTGKDSPVIDDLVRGLRDWLAKGGFRPDWDSYPRGAECFCTRRVA